MTSPYGLLSDPGEYGNWGQQPSAISSLLQQMTVPPPQMTPSNPPMAPPQAAQIPPQAPAQKPHMLHRIAGLLGSLGSNVASNVAGTVKGIGTNRTPAGYEGILSQPELEGAKGSRLQNILFALGGISPQAQYQDRLNNIVKVHDVARGMGEQKRLDKVRANMAALFTPKPGATPDEVRDMNEQMFAYAIRNNDQQTAKLLETANVEAMRRTKAMPVLHEVEGKGWWDMTDPKNPTPVVMSDPSAKNKQIVSAQEGIFEMRGDGLYDAATGAKYTGKTVHPVALAPSYTTFQDYNPTDPNAPPTTRTLDTKTGVPGQAIGTGKPATTRIESAINTAAKARLTAAVSEMNNAHQGMTDFEQKLKDGKISINGLSQFAGATANSFTHDDPASRLVQSAALTALNKVNPELARYIRRGLSFAEGESMISQRPSDFRTKMAAFLSTAAAGASPEMIADIESRRSSIMDPLNEAVKPATPKTPSATTAPKTPQELWDAAVAQYGQERVLREYGPRP